MTRARTANAAHDGVKGKRMADEPTNETRELARRIIRAAGIDDAALAESARVQFERAAAVAPVADGESLTSEQQWTRNSSAQLQRWFAGFCLSCRHWTPTTDDRGTCATITGTPERVTFGGNAAATSTATWGCHCYEEIPGDDPDTLTARTELAMALGMLQPYPAP